MIGTRDLDHQKRAAVEHTSGMTKSTKREAARAICMFAPIADNHGVIGVTG